MYIHLCRIIRDVLVITFEISVARFPPSSIVLVVLFHLVLDINPLDVLSWCV